MPQTKTAKTPEEKLIVVPFGGSPSPTSYESRGIVSVECKLTKATAEAFVRVRAGLRDSNAKLESGRPVFSNADVLRWMLEQIEA